MYTFIASILIALAILPGCQSEPEIKPDWVTHTCPSDSWWYAQPTDRIARHGSGEWVFVRCTEGGGEWYNEGIGMAAVITKDGRVWNLTQDGM